MPGPAVILDRLADLGAHAVDGARNAAGQHLAQHQHIGLEVKLARATFRTHGDGVRLVDEQQSAGSARQAAHRLMKTRFRRHHADIGHMRLGEHHGDVARRERGFERRDIVELDDFRGVLEIETVGADTVLRRHAAVAELDLCFVHRPVILAVEHQHLVAAGDQAGNADGEAVGIGRRDGHLPVGQAEEPGKAACHDDGVFRRQHIGCPATGDLSRHHLGDGRIGVAEEGRGIAEAEIDIAMSVDIRQPGADRSFGEDRIGAAPLAHPMQGHAVRHVTHGFFVQDTGARMRGDEAFLLAQPQAGEQLRGDAVARRLVC